MVLIGEHDGNTSGNNERPPSSSPFGSQESQQEQEQTNRNSSANNNMNDNPELLIKLLLEAAKRLWLQIKTASNFVMVDLGGYQLFDQLARWCVQHPQIAICVLAAGLVTFVPFLLLVGFGLSTILMTFTGFLVLEGTLLTILSMMLFGLLGALLIVMLFFAVIAVAAYFGFAHIYDLYGNVELHRSALSKFLQKENRRTERVTLNGNHMENSQGETIN